MGAPINDGKMEGWLYLIRSNRFGLQYSQKRYFVLQDDCLKSFKSVPVSENEEPNKSAVIDSYIRVTDNGRESIHRKVFFIFTLHNTVNQNDRLKLGASSPEDAARWIRSLLDTTLKGCSDPARNFRDRSKRQYPVLRFRGSKRIDWKASIDWIVCSSVQMEAMTSDVIAPSPWKIFGCQNGLRLFKESKDNDSHRRQWDDHPAIMAVGMVCGTSEEIFRTLMSLGSSRSETNFLLSPDGTSASSVEVWSNTLTVIQISYICNYTVIGYLVLLYHSVFHVKFPPQKGYVRACLKSGGYVVTPVNQGKHSLVKHMLAVDWKFWKLYLRPSSARAITIRMVERLAALRELFRAKVGDSSSEFSSSSRDLRHFELPQSDIDEIKTEIQSPETMRKIKEAFLKENEAEMPRASLIGLNDAVDEFFDVPEPAELDHYENEWTSDLTLQQLNMSQNKLSTAAVFVKKLHDLAVQKKGYTELPELPREESMAYSYGSTLPKDFNFSTPCSVASADPSLFLIRGENYLKDSQKIKANGTLMQLVGADWLRSDRREDNLGGRPGSIVQKYAERGGTEFFFVVNIQVPGTTMYTLAMYYMMRTPLESSPLLKNFVEGDDAFRNSRFKLIPYISQGSWIVKQSVGKKACLVGHALEVHYFRGKNYLEVEIDVGSSTVARGVVSLVLGYLNNLVIEMAFVIQGNTQEELPEILLGTCRLNHLDVAKSLLVKP
ncbi:protein ENHANCED DISEASE RESISTANCE 2-like isoform X1 [Cucumis melo var. makuwa]|uniref:Protein ENHANCED DISEASE RESISTANCE 2-like isoform X1 n=1 Tax=Cucumis melo var. makuwa TaxID=1194695 RepID=A0A5D3BMR3_CUCMM|nr:protein ENHANCED DISEASE RESISTANCE 2-like isoform X1 [Cucumis melo var. makuwa]